MSKKLFVGNLPFSTDEAKLKGLFASYGELGEVLVVKNKYSGRSKGFGFVTINDDTMAEKAKTEVNGKEVEGRKIMVNDATPFDPNKPRERRFGGGGGFGRREGGFGGNRGGFEERKFAKKKDDGEGSEGSGSGESQDFSEEEQ